MPTLTLRPTRSGTQLHQKNWGQLAALAWRKWRDLQARRQLRSALRELADDPHLLRDLGVTREDALNEVNRPFWR
jgi:uncharacterized protein YjiS (DUF1127 family)